MSSSSTHFTYTLTPTSVLIMAAATGFAVAGNYYAQPLLPAIASDMGLPASSAGAIVTVAQLGYAIGLLMLVPLGDILEQRRLIVAMALLTAGGLLITAVAPSIAFVFLGTALAGLFSVMAQVLLPLAATLAQPEKRGRVIGTIMSGLLLGILLARTVAGGLAGLGNWRTVYWAGAFAMLLMAFVLARCLPRYQTTVGMSYPRLLLSVIALLKDEPALRLRAFLGAMSFAAFSVLWTSMAFLLAAPPFNYAAGVIGLFGLVGAAGAFAASAAGRMNDRGYGKRVVKWGLVLLLVSWVPLLLAQYSMTALIVGILGKC